MPEPVLAVAGLRKEFGDLVAVDDVTFTVPARARWRSWASPARARPRSPG